MDSKNKSMPLPADGKAKAGQVKLCQEMYNLNGAISSSNEFKFVLVGAFEHLAIRHRLYTCFYEHQPVVYQSLQARSHANK